MSTSITEKRSISKKYTGMFCHSITLKEGLRPSLVLPFSDFLLFIVKGRPTQVNPYALTITNQISLEGKTIIAPHETDEAPIFKDNDHTAKGDVFATGMSFGITQTLTMLEAGIEPGKVQKSLPTLVKGLDASRYGYAKVLQATGQLIIEAWEGKIRSPITFRDRGLSIISQIAQDGNYKAKDRALINLMLEHRPKFVKFGLARLCSKYPEAVPQRYLDAAARAIYNDREIGQPGSNKAATLSITRLVGSNQHHGRV